MSEPKKRDTPEDWGSYMHQKKSKLKDQFEASCVNAREQLDDDLKSLFKGVTIYVNGYTRPSADDLKEIITAHGGVYDPYYSKSRTTHVVATNLCFSKVKNLRETDKVVRPEWITESILARKLLPVKSYLVYRPDQIPKQPSVASSTVTRADDSSNDSQLQLFDSNSNLSTGSKGSPMKSSVKSPTKNDVPSLKAGDPGFLEAFFGKSRLHHLSSSGNDFKAYVQELREKSSLNHSFDGLEELKKHVMEMKLQMNDLCSDGKKIMHIDMDCFFVSVGLLKRPHLVNKPVVVTHAKSARGATTTSDMSIEYESNYYGNRFNAIAEESNSSDGTNAFRSRSEIACASYEARACGVKNGSYLGTAKQLCPNLIEIPYDFEEYERVSRILYNTLASFTLEIEAVSCDEMFVDVTNVLSDAKCSADIFASFLRKLIHDKSGCAASIGIGPNILIAKLASKNAKPNGQVIIAPDQVLEFMKKQQVADLPGVGRTTASKLAELFSAETCGDLIKTPEERLKSQLGIKTGERLYSIIRGRDRSNLMFDQASARKSVSAEVNYGIRLDTLEQLNSFMKELSAELASRMSKVNSKGKQLTVKMKIRKEDAPKETAKFMGHGVCNSVSRSSILHRSMNSAEDIHKVTMKIIESLNIKVPDLRGIGIQMAKLEPIKSETETMNTNTEAMKSKMMIQDYFKGGENSNGSGQGINRSSLTTHILVPSIFDKTKPSTSFNTSNESPKIPLAKLKPLVKSKPVVRDESNFVNVQTSWAEVDQDILKELPKNIREEIITALKPTSSRNADVSIVLDTSSSRSSTKKKNQSNKSKKGAKAIKEKSVKQNTAKSPIKVQSGPLDTMFKKMNQDSRHKTVLKVMSMPGALCGQKDIMKMCEFVTEWVATESDPLDSDISCIIKLFTDLIQFKDFCKLKQLVETFYEQVLTRNSINWKRAFNTVSEIVAMELDEEMSEEMVQFKRNIPNFELVEL